MITNAKSKNNEASKMCLAQSQMQASHPDNPSEAKNKKSVYEGSNVLSFVYQSCYFRVYKVVLE